jgi:hypothetical protein
MTSHKPFLIKTITLAIAICCFKLTIAQSDKFRAIIVVEDSIIAHGSHVIFPLLKDTIKIGDNNIAIIDLSNPKNRLFYFTWTGWNSKIFRFDSDSASDEIRKVKVPDTSFYRQFQQKNICPVCLKSRFLIPIVYSFPTEKMFNKAKRNKLRLGGCIIYCYSAKFYCKKDNFEF